MEQKRHGQYRLLLEGSFRKLCIIRCCANVAVPALALARLIPLRHSYREMTTLRYRQLKQRDPHTTVSLFDLSTAAGHKTAKRKSLSGKTNVILENLFRIRAADIVLT